MKEAENPSKEEEKKRAMGIVFSYLYNFIDRRIK
jgi:hypothetical protein